MLRHQTGIILPWLVSTSTLRTQQQLDASAAPTVHAQLGSQQHQCRARSNPDMGLLPPLSVLGLSLVPELQGSPMTPLWLHPSQRPIILFQVVFSQRCLDSTLRTRMSRQQLYLALIRALTAQQPLGTPIPWFAATLKLPRGQLWVVLALELF